MLLDQVAQRPGPGRGGTPAAGGGLDRAPPLGGQVPGGFQGGQGDIQVPGREGLPGLVGGLAMAATVPAASAVTAGSGPGPVPASACCPPSAVPPAVPGAGWPASVVLPAGSASCCPSPGVLAPGVSAAGASAAGASGASAGGTSPGVLAGRGASAAGASVAGASGAGAGFQVSAMPGRLPLTRVAVPAFSQASRACRAAGTLSPARSAMTATAAPAGSADSAARTAAAGLSPVTGAMGAGSGAVAVSAALRAACGAGAGAGVRAMMVTPFLVLRRYSGFRFDCAGVFWTTIALVPA